MLENVPTKICAQRRLKSAYESAQPDQSIRCPHEEVLYHWQYKTRPGKIRIRLLSIRRLI